MRTVESKVEQARDRPHLLHNFAGTFVSQGYMVLGAAAVNIITARALGPSGKGEYTLAINLFAVLSIAAGFGLAQANVFFVGKRAHIRHVLANSLLISTLAGLSTFVLVWLFRETISGLLSGLPIFDLLIIATILPLQLMLIFSRHIFLGQGQVGRYNLARNLELTFQIGIMGLLLIPSKLHPVSAIMSALAAAVFALVWVLYSLRDYLSFAIDLRQLKQSLNYGIKAYLSEMAQFLNFRLDMFLVAFFLDIKSVGYYSVAVAVTQLLSYLSQASHTVLFSASATSSEARMDQVTPRVCRTIAAALLALAALLYLASGYLVAPIFGSGFSATVLPLRLLLPGMVVLGIQQILYADLAGRGHPQVGTYASLIALVATLVLDIMLIPKLGIAGAALASSVAYGIGGAFVLISFTRLTGASLLDTLIVKWSDLTTLWDLKSRLWLQFDAKTEANEG